MAQAHRGFEYERNAAKILKKYKLVPQGFEPAGAGSEQPDLILEHKKIRAGCELKITAASAGSLVLKYDIDNKVRHWGFNVVDHQDPEKLFIKHLAEKIGILDQLHKQWKNIPFKRDRDALWNRTAAKMTPKQRYKRDLEKFPEINGEIDPAEIEKYYNKKDTHYLNVGTHGFFLLGSKNPLKLNAPRFKDAATARYRARVQYKGNDNYQFTFEMSFGMIQQSPFNISPIDGKTVDILKENLDLSAFGIEV